MNCDWVQTNISACLYNELVESEREALQEHVISCEACSSALEDERRFLRRLNERQRYDAPGALLAECRHDLLRSVYHGERYSRFPGGGLLAWWRDVERTLGSMRLAWQPFAAVLLVVAGFSAGRMTTGSPAEQAEFPMQASLAPLDSTLAGIQSVGLDPEQGNVEIVVEETTRRVIAGPPQDPRIRTLLLSTVKSDPNSGIRLDTLDILTRRVDDQAVRQALLQAMVADENPGVRLKALAALQSRKRDPDLRRALVEVVRYDRNPGMRVQAIDLLTETPDRDLAGLFQDLVESEGNNYVRLRSLRTLQELNASVDRF